MQLHESVGHAVELDRVLGREASYAGTSFVPADAIGSFRFGSEQVNVTADATHPGGLGSYRWDDEGVEGHSVPIVRDGVLAGFLSSRETAAEIGLERSGGCMRADGFARQPIVRMTNVSLEPGDAGTLADLIADTESGLLIDTNRSWSIDDRRLNFQFEGEAGWEIKNGELGRLVRNPSYAGVTPAFWAGCDAVCSESEWQLHALLDCGKGEPGQTAHVSHGAAPARFRDVRGGGRLNALDVAEAAVAAAPTRDALAHVTHERSLLLRFAANRPTQATAIDDVTVELAIVIDGHARAGGHQRDRSGVAARLRAPRPRGGRGRGLHRPAGRTPRLSAPPGPLAITTGTTPRPRGSTLRTGGAALATTFATAQRHGLEAHGVWTVAEDERAVATSAGGGALDRTTDALMKVICIAPDGRSGYAASVGVAASKLDPEPARRARRREGARPRLRRRAPVGRVPGRDGAARGRLAARAAGRHRSQRARLRRGPRRAGRSARRAGRRAGDQPRGLAALPRHAAARLRRRGHAEAADPADPGRRGSRRGARPAQRRPGRGPESRGTRVSRAAATTARAPPTSCSPAAAPPASTELCAPIERGVYVTRFWYENVVRPKETLVTAVTRDGTFLIEDGRVTRPLRNLRLTDSVLGILSRVEDLSGGQELTSQAEFYGRRFAHGVVSPALRAGAVRFTDTTG